MSDANYNETAERDAWEADSARRDHEADETEHAEQEAVDRLRRDWPVPADA